MRKFVHDKNLTKYEFHYSFMDNYYICWIFRCNFKAIGKILSKSNQNFLKRIVKKTPSKNQIRFKQWYMYFLYVYLIQISGIINLFGILYWQSIYIEKIYSMKNRASDDQYYFALFWSVQLSWPKLGNIEKLPNRYIAWLSNVSNISWKQDNIALPAYALNMLILW